MSRRVVAQAPGKINPILRVGPLTGEGYHELFTLFHALDIWETVEVSDATEYRLTLEGSVPLGDVPLDESNLVVKGAKALAAEIGHDGAATLHIQKAIPVGGGMGGGSADAAAALVALNELWGSQADSQTLHRIALSLGADVPFALFGASALGRGYGGDLTRVHSGLFHWVLLPVDHHLSTPRVYRRLDELRAGHRELLPQELPEPLLHALAAGDPLALADHLHNDLASAAVDLHPPIATRLLEGERAGALWSMVSGSGPTCVLLARDAEHQSELVERLGPGGPAPLPTVSSPLGAHLV
ncbi:MAG: 4-diphosphocytidyl-2-C-methyl-D-erythritol kinase [Pontimonas sp.]|jgi:4-diphosphocytidyl-2-C-methyl-D-erythritol kinase